MTQPPRKRQRAPDPLLGPVTTAQQPNDENDEPASEQTGNGAEPSESHGTVVTLGPPKKSSAGSQVASPA